jgi:predicted HAD superfamily phosphohydrolase YqeG
MGTTIKNTIFVGDQLFTDVYGANRIGMTTYLVKPIHPKEEIQIVLKRKLERIVLHYYRKDLKKGKIQAD